MLLLDVERAFDSIWHDALLEKLIFRGCKSSVCNIPYEMPQDAVLSPTLYNFFTSDAPMADGCELASFADDTASFGSSSACL
jgi:hypothetical protein